MKHRLLVCLGCADSVCGIHESHLKRHSFGCVPIAHACKLLQPGTRGTAAPANGATMPEGGGRPKRRKPQTIKSWREHRKRVGKDTLEILP